MREFNLAMMQIETQNQPVQALAFSQTFKKRVERSSIASSDIAIATREELEAAMQIASEQMQLAEPRVARALYDHNPACFRIVRRSVVSESPMMTYLPLTASGVAALVDGRFDASSPDLKFVCRPHEDPEAIYLWLMFTPNKIDAGLRLLGELEAIGKGVTIFTRPIHRTSARILEMAGFLSAEAFFPGASKDLVFVPFASAPTVSASKRPALTIRVVRTFEDMAKIFSVRTATYMCEQLCSFDEEFDGNDFSATHLLGEVNGEPAGCVRIRYFGGFAKIERLAVTPQHRRSRLMRELARYALDFCARKGFKKIYGHVRLDLVPAWQKLFGARPIEGRNPFCFSDVHYQEMVFDLSRHGEVIELGADPMLLIRPEGEWDRLGPIERAQFMHQPERRQAIESLRQFRG